MRQEEFSRQWHKDHDEEIQNIGKSIDAIAKADEEINRLANETYSQCMRVLSNAVFCKCVSNNNPVSLNFVGFVMVNAFEQGDKQLSSIPIEAVVNARIAHRKCLNH